LLTKESWVYVTDNTNVKWLKIFQLYKGSFRRFTKEGLFIKGSARVVEPPRVEYKGFKYKYKIKGDVCRSWICRSVVKKRYKDHKIILFNDNSVLNITKKQNLMSKYINGPASKSTPQKKLLTLFSLVV